MTGKDRTEEDTCVSPHCDFSGDPDFSCFVLAFHVSQSFNIQVITETTVPAMQWTAPTCQQHAN